MNIVIKQCETCFSYAEVYIDGELVMSGDEYHNKISSKIEGFLEGLNYTKTKYTLKKETIKCKFYCD